MKLFDFFMVVALKCDDPLRPRRYNHAAELLQPFSIIRKDRQNRAF